MIHGEINHDQLNEVHFAELNDNKSRVYIFILDLEMVFVGRRGAATALIYFVLDIFACIAHWKNNFNIAGVAALIATKRNENLVSNLNWKEKVPYLPMGSWAYPDWKIYVSDPDQVKFFIEILTQLKGFSRIDVEKESYAIDKELQDLSGELGRILFGQPRDDMIT